MSMDTFTQPKITGYRQLNEQEAALMNEIKEHGQLLGALIERLRASPLPARATPALAPPEVDQRWVSIGATHLQEGLMALTRAVARPTSF